MSAAFAITLPKFNGFYEAGVAVGIDPSLEYPLYTLTMPLSCVIVGYHENTLSTDKKRRFFGFPKRHRSPARRDRWLAAVDRKNQDGNRWSPAKGITICSDHFPTFA